MAHLDDLVALVGRLRRECPWDREQTHRSLAPHLIEESYELLDAIEGGADAPLRDELGDLLLQVLLHAEIARERGAFGLEEVAAALSAKLIARHPHVFGDAAVGGAEAVKENWEKLKLREGRASVLDGLPAGLPALLLAKRVQEKAAAVGFDWKRAEEVRAKVAEETGELDAKIAAGDRAGIAEELGDLLFAVTNHARFLRVDPEAALRDAVGKFRERFRYVEEGLRAAGRAPGEATLEEMDALWEEAKRRR